jgi:hypothetical protein
MDTRPCATEQELAAWSDAVQTMDATTLGDFERRISPGYQHTSLVPLQMAIVNRRAQLERARWFRIKPSYSKPTGGFLTVGPLYAGEIVDDGKAVRFPWGSDRQWTETVPIEHVERNPEPRPAAKSLEVMPA